MKKVLFLLMLPLLLLGSCVEKKESGIIKTLNGKNDSKEPKNINKKINNKEENIYSVNRVLESELIDVSGLIYFNDKAYSGIVYELYNNGNLKFEYNISNGISDGKSEVFYSNGNLKYIGYFNKGKEDGIFKGWYENGILAFEKTFKNGYIDGEYKTWFSDGSIEYETYFNNGNGVTKNFHSNGQKMRILTYKNNNIVKSKCWDNQGNQIECNKAN